MFELSTKKLSGERGFVDLFWPGKLVAEQKSAGRNLDDAERQAGKYMLAMPEADLPEAIVVCDFQTFRVYHLISRETVEFRLADLPRHVQVLGFLVGRTSKHVAEEDPVNRRAAEAMATLHNSLEANRFTGLLTSSWCWCGWCSACSRTTRRSLSRGASRRTSGGGRTWTGRT